MSVPCQFRISSVSVPCQFRVGAVSVPCQLPTSAVRAVSDTQSSSHAYQTGPLAHIRCNGGRFPSVSVRCWPGSLATTSDRISLTVTSMTDTVRYVWLAFSVQCQWFQRLQCIFSTHEANFVNSRWKTTKWQRSLDHMLNCTICSNGNVCTLHIMKEYVTKWDKKWNKTVI
jgi:hypothetical protein